MSNWSAQELADRLAANPSLRVDHNPLVDRSQAKVTHLLLDMPLKIVSEANRRDHWAAKMKRRKAQQLEVDCEWKSKNGTRRFWLPCRVRFTRTGPKLLDDDNLRSSLKAVRDQVAKLLGTNDSPDAPVTWLYDQIAVGKHAYRLKIEVESDLV